MMSQEKGNDGRSVMPQQSKHGKRGLWKRVAARLNVDSLAKFLIAKFLIVNDSMDSLLEFRGYSFSINWICIFRHS